MWYNFNSIKVQLEHVTGKMKNSLPTFQFHKGTIRTSSPSTLFSVILDFNSIKVRLELSSDKMYQMCHIHFNSIKVRLEHL